MPTAKQVSINTINDTADTSTHQLCYIQLTGASTGCSLVQLNEAGSITLDISEACRLRFLDETYSNDASTCGSTMAAV